MLVVGDKEVEEGTVAVRSRFDADLGSMSVESISDLMDEEVKNYTKHV